MNWPPYSDDSWSIRPAFSQAVALVHHPRAEVDRLPTAAAAAVLVVRPGGVRRNRHLQFGGSAGGDEGRGRVKWTGVPRPPQAVPEAQLLWVVRVGEPAGRHGRRDNGHRGVGSPPWLVLLSRPIGSRLDAEVSVARSGARLGCFAKVGKRVEVVFLGAGWCL